MKYVVIRDDDVSYFTKPAILKKLYDPLISEKKPISFALIPRITANIKTDVNNPYRKQGNLEYDPIIPPKLRGKDESFSISENNDLVQFIKSYERFEVLQHGFSHGLFDGQKEFKISNKKEIQRRINSGSELLQQCFHMKPSFFVPPWDNVSSQAISLLKSSYEGLSIGRLNPFRLPTVSWITYLKKMLYSRSYMFYENLLIIEHCGYMLTRFNNPELIFKNFKNVIESKEIIILVNHHWEYFFDWGKLDLPFFGAWEKITDFLLNKENLKIITFNELYNILKDRKT